MNKIILNEELKRMKELSGIKENISPEPFDIVFHSKSKFKIYVSGFNDYFGFRKDLDFNFDPSTLQVHWKLIIRKDDFGINFISPKVLYVTGELTWRINKDELEEGEEAKIRGVLPNVTAAPDFIEGFILMRHFSDFNIETNFEIENKQCLPNSIDIYFNTKTIDVN